MVLTKAFDPAALVTALKSKGIVDAEKLVNTDVIPVLFDWLNTSVNLEVPAPYGTIATGILVELEAKAVSAINKAEGLAG